MKPPKFKYLRPESAGEALEALRAEDARVLAGGQSLVPMLNFRLLRPAVLVDINRLAGLDYIEETAGGGLRIGALARHHRIETSPLVKRLFPMVAAAVAHIGHLAIRNRGTIGGSLCHADPTAEHLLLAVLLDASLTLQSHRGARTVRARDFVTGALSTALEPHEMLAGVELAPLAPGAGWGFEEYARRSGDFAIAAAAVVLRASGGKVAEARIAVSGGVNGPVRVPAAEALLAGRAAHDKAIDEAVAAAREALAPNADLHASAELRRHVLGSLVRRACKAAWQRALGGEA